MEDTGKEKKVLKFDKKKSIIVGSISIGLLLALVTIAIVIYANRGYQSIEVKTINGTLNVKRGRDVSKGFETMVLRTKDEISTEAESMVRLKLDDSKYVVMEEKTSVKIETAGSKKSNKMKLVLKEGAISSIISEPLEETSTYEVHTPNVTMSVRGTKFRVAYDIFDNVQVVDTAVTDGKVLVTTFYYDEDGHYHLDEEMEVPKGKGYLVIVTEEPKGTFSFEKYLYTLPSNYVISEYFTLLKILPVPNGFMPLDIQEKYNKLHNYNSNSEPTPQVSTGEVTSTPAPSETPVPTAVPTTAPDPTAVPSDTPAPTEAPTDTPVPTVEPTKVPDPTSTPKPTPKPTNVPTSTPKPTKTPTAAPKPTAAPSPTPGKVAPSPIPTAAPRPLKLTISNGDTKPGAKKSDTAKITFTHQGEAGKEIIIKSISFSAEHFNITSVDGDAKVTKVGDYYVVTFGPNTKLSSPNATLDTILHGKIDIISKITNLEIPISITYGGEPYDYTLK